MQFLQCIMNCLKYYALCPHTCNSHFSQWVEIGKMLKHKNHSKCTHVRYIYAPIHAIYTFRNGWR